MNVWAERTVGRDRIKSGSIERVCKQQIGGVTNVDEVGCQERTEVGPLMKWLTDGGLYTMVHALLNGDEEVI
jgi:hypothetical protein